MKTHLGYLRLTGLVWLLMGAWLMFKGIRLVLLGSLVAESLSSRFGDVGQGAAVLVAAGLVIGHFKGRYVLKKSVMRVAGRIFSLPLPISLRKLYAPSYWILIGSMMALGILMNFLPIPLDVRGCIDVAIGAALINGSILYFKLTLKNPSHL